MSQREIDLQEFIDEIYQDYKDNPKDSKYIFFLGAGCSKSSGIPLAWELAKTWHDALKSQPSKFDKFNTKHKLNTQKKLNYAQYYFEIFEERFVSSKDQQREIQRITSDKLPSLGYYTLAKLMQKPSFNTVITTNFDDLIQDALIYSGDKRALAITHQDLSTFIERNSTPLIVKLHGDAHLHPFNSTSTTREIPKALKDAITQLSNNVKMVFIGYGGNDESIANLLESCSRVSYIYWLSTKVPTEVKLKKWWENTTDKAFVNERDFDKVMLAFKSKFDLEKPNFEDRAKKLKEAYSISNKKETQELKNKEDKTELEYFLLGNSYYEQKDYNKAIEAYQKSIEINPKKEDVYYNMGIAYDALKDYNKAIEAYKKSIEINPKKEVAYHNMGLAYAHLREFAKAIDAFSESIKIKPKNSASFTKLFELQLTQNQLFNSELEAKYIALFANHKEKFIQYEMLKILQDLVEGREVDMGLWSQKYRGVGLDAWGFDGLDSWVGVMGEGEVKTKLLDALLVFKSHRAT